MSQDLFAAFGDPPPVEGDSHSQRNEFGEDDDWGDFEDASSKNTVQDVKQTPNDDSETPHISSSLSTNPPPRNAGKQHDQPHQSPQPGTGKHPFAGHMDFLFEPGEDEYTYDADLDNLSTNPEAAMAFSKRLIAQQEARAISSLSKQDNQSSSFRQTEKTAGAANSSQHAKTGTNKMDSPTFPVSSARSMSHQSRQAATPSISPNKLKKKSGYAPAKDPNVLFDADNVSESDDDGDDDVDADDFGDFEGDSKWSGITTGPTSSAISAQPSTMPNIDLLGLTDDPKPFEASGRSNRASEIAVNVMDGVHRPEASHEHVRSDLFEADNPWADFEPNKHSAPQTSHSRIGIKNADSIPHAVQDDAGWGDFDDFESSEPAPKPEQYEAHSSMETSKTRSDTHKTTITMLPPTNIPPPVLLLSVFPSLFSSAQEDLFGPLSKLDSTQRQQLLSHPATHQFLCTYLTQTIVLAHIIAGRKLRWKRDQILAQSMRIGPTASGGKGGMKLMGIDKSEVAKEDRELLDAIRLWKSQLGKLRGAVTGASNAAKLPPVPEISEQMPVKVLKAVEGGFVAPHACALCGLKREERVAKVDVNVDDSFGEWWVNGMDMHLTCKTWWDENKRKLQSR